MSNLTCSIKGDPVEEPIHKCLKLYASTLDLTVVGYDRRRKVFVEPEIELIDATDKSHRIES